MRINAAFASLFWLGGIAFALSLILTPILRDVFRSYGVVDQPDHGRKIHKIPVPRVGGVAIAVAYVCAFLFAPKPEGSVLQQNVYLVWRLLPAAAAIFATGIIDDLFGLKPWQKIIGQFAGASIAYFAGVRLLFVIGIAAEDWWSYPATVLWLLVCTNAFNLVDGMDGLAGGIGLVATLTIFVAALVHNSPALALATFPLAGCLLAFLCYNFNPATIFLGDSGSLLIGFLLGCFGIIWTQKSATLLGMTAPLMALSIPLLDTCLCIVRRSLKRQPIFSPDRGHIHHKLLDRGLTPRRAALLVYGVCSLVACFSLVQSTVKNDAVGGLITLLFCGIAWIGIQYLGYAEFSVVGKMLFSGDFQRTLKFRLELRAFEKALAMTTSMEECWLVLRSSSEKCGFLCYRMIVEPGVAFTAAKDAEPGECWSMTIPILESGFLEFRHPLRSPASSGIVGPFVEAISGSLAPKLRALREQPSAPSLNGLGVPKLETVA